MPGIVPSFFIPALFIVTSSLVLLLITKAFFKDALPDCWSMVAAIAAFLVVCLCMNVVMFFGRDLTKLTALWIEKIISLFGLLLFIKFFCKKKTLRELGVCLPKPKKIAITAFIFALLGTIAWGTSRQLAFHQEFSVSRFIFMLTVSGVDEELVFRGVMPSLLVARDGSSACIKANKIFVFFIPTVIFTLIHALRFVGGHFAFSGYVFCVIGIGACAFMYLRLQTGSLLNSIVIHNILNAGTVIALGVF